jgi:hypothetical protein
MSFPRLPPRPYARETIAPRVRAFAIRWLKPVLRPIARHTSGAANFAVETARHRSNANPSRPGLFLPSFARPLAGILPASRCPAVSALHRQLFPRFCVLIASFLIAIYISLIDSNRRAGSIIAGN